MEEGREPEGRDSLSLLFERSNQRMVEFMNRDEY